MNYHFELTNRIIESTRNNLKSRFFIEATASRFKSTSLFIQFELECGSSNFVIKDLKLNSNAAWSEEEHIAYLKGYFGFTDRREIEAAISGLINKIDNEHYILNFDTKWLDFVEEFTDWYKGNIKPLLDDEFKIFSRYSKRIN